MNKRIFGIILVLITAIFTAVIAFFMYKTVVVFNEDQIAKKEIIYNEALNKSKEAYLKFTTINGIIVQKTSEVAKIEEDIISAVEDINALKAQGKDFNDKIENLQSNLKALSEAQLKLSENPITPSFQGGKSNGELVNLERQIEERKSLYDSLLHSCK